MKNHNSRRMTALMWLIGLIVIGSVSAPLAEPRPEAQSDNPLERHRQRKASGQVREAVLQGQIVRVDEGYIITSLSSVELAASQIEDQDKVSVRIQGHTLTARIVSGDTYRELVADQQAMDNLDVDVLGVKEDGSTLVIFGVSGNLADWLGARPGLPVTLRKR